MSVTANSGTWRHEMIIVSAELYSKLQGRLFGILPRYLRGLSKYEPLWLEADFNSEMRIKNAHALIQKRNTSSYGRLRRLLSQILDEKTKKLTDICNRFLGSRYGWILELYARFYGVNVGHCIFEKLWICLSDEKRAELSKIVYLMSEPRYCQLKKLLYSLPDDRYWDFVDALEAASDKQFNHYIRLLSTTHHPNPIDVLDGRTPGTLARPFTNQVPIPVKVEVNEEEWCELQHRILNLPFELRKMIESALWDIAFRPGKIFPHNQQKFGAKYYSCGKFYDPPIPRLFRALNKELYTQMRKRYWSENVWVIGYGDADDTMGFLDHVLILSQTDSGVNLHLELRFSSSDIPKPSNLCPTSSDRWLLHYRARMVKSSNLDALDILPFYQLGVYNLSYDLRDLWSGKLWRLRKVRYCLDELTLDLNEAFIPGDVFAAGMEDFSYHEFRHLMPPVLKVRSPSKSLEDEIYKELRFRNP